MTCRTLITIIIFRFMYPEGIKATVSFFYIILLLYERDAVHYRSLHLLLCEQPWMIAKGNSNNI